MKTVVAVFFLSSLYTAWNPGQDNSGIVLYNDVTTYRWTESQERFFQSWKSNPLCHQCHSPIHRSYETMLTTKQDTIHTYCKDEFLKTHAYLN